MTTKPFDDVVAEMNPATKPFQDRERSVGQQNVVSDYVRDEIGGRMDKGCKKRSEAHGAFRSCLFVDGHNGPCAFSFGAALARRDDGPDKCTQCRAPCTGKKGDVVVLCATCRSAAWDAVWTMRD
jgi:hypothetical protein